MTKVDRILELEVIDWLQWAETFDSDKAQLALTMIAKRKAELTSAKAQAEKLAEALSFYAEKMNWHYHGYDDEPGIINSCDVDNNGDGGKEARAALAYYRKEMEE